MRSLVYILLCLLVLFHAVSCVKKVTLKLPPFEKRLVVHGYIATGELFKVTVGRSFRDNPPGWATYLSDALVLLYENGVLKDTLRYNPTDKNYVSAHMIAETGKPYTIKVEAAGFPSVEATATSPFAPGIQSIKHIRKARQDNGGYYLDDVEFTFQDPAGVRNYYITGIYPANGGGFGCVYSADPVIEREKSSLWPIDETACIDSRTILFADNSFNGQSKMIRLSAKTDQFDLIPIPPQAPIPRVLPHIKMYAIDSIYYDYFKYLASYYSSNDLSFVTENTEKKGNIINGHGIFTIFDVRVDSIR